MTSSPSGEKPHARRLDTLTHRGLTGRFGEAIAYIQFLCAKGRRGGFPRVQYAELRLLPERAGCGGAGGAQRAPRRSCSGGIEFGRHLGGEATALAPYDQHLTVAEPSSCVVRQGRVLGTVARLVLHGPQRPQCRLLCLGQPSNPCDIQTLASSSAPRARRVVFCASVSPVT